MDSPKEIEACSHGLIAGARFRLTLVLDDWQGATLGLFRCAVCDQHYLLSVQAWAGQNLTRRVYAFEPVNGDIARVFTRNLSSDFCDLERHRAEVSALAAAAGKVEGFVLVDLTRSEVIRTIKANAEPVCQFPDWREELPCQSVWQHQLEDG